MLIAAERNGYLAIIFRFDDSEVCRVAFPREASERDQLVGHEPIAADNNGKVIYPITKPHKNDITLKTP